jgi:hypothetical protein
MSDVLNSIGYFDDAAQTEPAHNPCPEADCPVCEKRNDGHLCYRSVMPMGGRRSYFFAYHKACAGSPKIDAFEQRVMDEVFDWDGSPQ